MKKVYTLLILLIIVGISFGQTGETQSKNSIGVLFSSGYVSKDVQVFGFGLRGTHTLSKLFSIGAELNYQEFLGTYGNSDAMGIIGFGRLTPFGKGLFMELGAQGNTIVSSARSATPTLFSPYCALGYQAKICKNTSVQMQIRPITFNGSRIEFFNELPGRTNFLQKIYFGFNYYF